MRSGRQVYRQKRRVYLFTCLRYSSQSRNDQATAEAVEEAILKALCAAETMTGQQGCVAYALPLDELQKIMNCK